MNQTQLCTSVFDMKYPVNFFKKSNIKLNKVCIRPIFQIFHADFDDIHSMYIHICKKTIIPCTYSFIAITSSNQYQSL
jgi:hypothetical protein